MKKEILNPYINDPILGWFDEVKTNVPSGSCQCAMGGAVIRYRYDKKAKLQAFIPKSLIDNISFDDINNNFCFSAGVTHKDKRFYMIILRDGWFKTKVNDKTGWIYSKSMKADYYGFRHNYEKKWATFVKEEITCYETPSHKAEGVKSGMCFWGGRREIFEIKDAWVNLHKPNRSYGFWAPKSKIVKKIETEKAKPWYGEITDDKAYVYIEPDNNSKRLITLKRGDRVLLLEKTKEGKRYTGYKNIDYKLVDAICTP